MVDASNTSAADVVASVNDGPSDVSFESCAISCPVFSEYAVVSTI